MKKHLHRFLISTALCTASFQSVQAQCLTPSPVYGEITSVSESSGAIIEDRQNIYSRNPLTNTNYTYLYDVVFTFPNVSNKAFSITSQTAVFVGYYGYVYAATTDEITLVNYRTGVQIPTYSSNAGTVTFIPNPKDTVRVIMKLQGCNYNTRGTSFYGNKVVVSAAISCVTSYKDTDGDGFGSPTAPTKLACPTATAGYVLNNTDCNDADIKQKPGAKWYPDLDGDGFGDMSATPVISCTKPTGLNRTEGTNEVVSDSTDCDDKNATINPNATEILGNNIDENCDNAINLNNSLHFKVIDSLNAKNTYLEVANSANMPISNLFTIEFWLKWENVSGSSVRYLVKKGSFEIYIAGGQINFSNGNDSRSFYLTANEWKHYAVTYNNGSMQIYQNGLPYSLYPSNLPVTGFAGNALVLGHKTTSPYSQTFTGSLDEFRVYNRSKTASEITQEMNKMADTTDASLLVYYRFDQGSPNGDNSAIISAINDAGSGYSGLLNNFVLKTKQANFVAGAPAFNIAPTPIVTSTEVENVANIFSVYPNPSNGTFSVSSTSELGNVSVFNSLGTIVYQNTTSAKQLNIELPSKEEGIYFVKVGNKMTKLIKE